MRRQIMLFILLEECDLSLHKKVQYLVLFRGQNLYK